MSDHDDTAGRTKQDQDQRGVRRTPRAQGHSGPRGRQAPGTGGEPRPVGGEASEPRQRSGTRAGAARVAGPGAGPEAPPQEPRPEGTGPDGPGTDPARVVTVDAEVSDPAPAPPPATEPAPATAPPHASESVPPTASAGSGRAGAGREHGRTGTDRPGPGRADGAWTLRPRGVEPGEVRERWRETQGGFVDDPRRAVQEAEALATEVADALVAEIEARRSALRSAWSDGDGSDTEVLRVALRDYRSFVEELVGKGT
ncbi:hypothetical protein ACFWTE_14940 [Nocardiopsis sp. NPDC058631]|uniref:hypothetical protein n=1 Tax=Nocardiopsis sp. NPDC058631 TaxID=3346566 RepID=UPI003662765B